jgi:hypothetical protein
MIIIDSGTDYTRLWKNINAIKIIKIWRNLVAPFEWPCRTYKGYKYWFFSVENSYSFVAYSLPVTLS